MLTMTSTLVRAERGFVDQPAMADTVGVSRGQTTI